MKLKWLLPCVPALLGATLSVSAHHSFAATYDES
jgi:hypothetical protein